MPVVSPVVWYASAADFEIIRAASLDADILPDTYASWLVLAERGLAQILAHGKLAFPAQVRAAEFLPWCEARRLSIDSNARTQYVSLLVADWCARELNRERCSPA